MGEWAGEKKIIAVEMCAFSIKSSLYGNFQLCSLCWGNLVVWLKFLLINNKAVINFLNYQSYPLPNDNENILMILLFFWNNKYTEQTCLYLYVFKLSVWSPTFIIILFFHIKSYEFSKINKKHIKKMIYDNIILNIWC